MRVVVDAFGGDNAPFEIVKGAALASNKFEIDITCLLYKRRTCCILAREYRQALRYIPACFYPPS